MIKKTFFLSVLLFSVTASFGQKISDLKLDNKQSILNDRAFFQFPNEAKNIARQTDIMSENSNINRETRIVLDIEEQRLVFFARELYVTSNNNLLEVLSMKKKKKEILKILTDTDSLQSVLITPTTFDSTANAILVNNLYVQTQDGTVFVIGAYINPNAYKNKDDFQKLTENVFSTLTKGNRKLNFKARIEKVPIFFDSKKKFNIVLSEGYIITKNSQYDFEVLNIQKVRDIADTNWFSLTIYTGNHPSYFYGEYDFDKSSAIKTDGQFLNKKIVWLNFKNDEEQFYLKEQQIPIDQIAKGLIAHIAMLGNSQESINELTKLIENIEITK
jgi:hypothetical protein